MYNGREIGNDFFIQMKRARGKLVENLQKIGDMFQWNRG